MELAERAGRLDAIAQTYDTTVDFDRHSIQYERGLIARTAHGRRLLEVGCGWGDMTEFFAPRFERVVALDGSGECVRRCRARVDGHTHIEWVHCLVEQFRTDGQFEDIVMVRVLEHLDDPVAILRKLAGYLAPMGQLHLVVPNARSLHRRLGKAMGLLAHLDSFSPRDIQYGHRRVYDRCLLTQHVEAAGLQVVETQGVLIKPLSNAQMESWDPAVIQALFEVGREEPDLCNELYMRVARSVRGAVDP
jgi:2-polyprenyl-3-methyl-5-hydroxy-6-metoxy-1,4-benzoquinol methylase